ncbi:Arginine transport system permease protein ArtQ [Serratia odorifera]|uniref:Arginine transport system permease protein ArtQ n=1 Tax=Serratia odorifera TaxID=618 RepID=A0A3S4FIA9_SEROD|nr:Arginine transport system permease protein ArtQ [Serratia odorifera]
MNFRWEIIQEYAPLFMEGAWMTIKCTLICVLLGTTWGLILGLGRLAQAPHGIWKHILHYGVQWPVRIYISAFRGTPLFVQIMVVHFALVPLFINPRDGLLVTSGIMSSDFARALRSDYGAFLSCVVAITLNAGAYVSEIFRAGIQSIDRGQMEASRSLGMSYGKTMRKVILPQAFRRMLPPLGNNAIRHRQGFLAGFRHWSGRSGLCRTHRVRRLRDLLGTLSDDLTGLLGHHLRALADGATHGKEVR